MASAFVLWALAVVASVRVRCRLKSPLLRVSGWKAWFCWALATLAGAVLLVNIPEPWVRAVPSQAHGPLGEGRGIHPGRVIWVHSPEATDWAGFGSDEHWFDSEHTSPAATERMMSEAIRALAGQTTDAAAWQALFRHFNQEHGLGDRSYEPTEKIAIKVNLVTCWSGQPPSSGPWVDPATHRKTVHVNGVDVAPQMVRALLMHLVHTVGVQQTDITVGDPTALWPDEYLAVLEPEFPDVRYLDNQGWAGRSRAEFSTTPVGWSTPDATGRKQDLLPTAFAEADYFINFAVLKGHSSGVTLCGKNNYGSLIRLPNRYCRDAGVQDYLNLHESLPNAPWSPGLGRYRAIVDLMGHAKLGNNTLLCLIDGLYGGYYSEAHPLRWLSSPFGDGTVGDWPSSLFASQDQVAIDSVAYDFLMMEWPDVVQGGGAAPNSLEGGAEDYLHEAALANAPPSGIFYDPDKDGDALRSLGVHEHWNSPLEKRYSRNVGLDEGIELMAIELSPAADLPLITEQPFGVTAYEGERAELRIVAAGPGPLQYQWTRNGSVLEGATNSLLVLSAAQLTDAGTYIASVSNPAGRIESAPASVSILPAPAGVVWESLPTGASGRLWGVDHGAGVYVAVGDNGQIRTSTDGRSWAAQVSPTTSTLYGLKYAAGRFIAAGNKGALVTSTNGLGWEPIVTEVTTALADVGYGEGRFVVVGNYGVVLTSVGGVASWQTVAPFTTKHLQDITCADGQFIVTGTEGFVALSADGLAWTILDPGTSAGLPASGRGHGRWWVGGSGGDIRSSADGQDWALADSGVTALVAGFGMGWGRLLAVGGPGTGMNAGFILVCTDGLTWKQAAPEPIPTPYDIVFTGAGWLAVGEGGSVVRSVRVLPPWALEVGVEGSGSVEKDPNQGLHPQGAAVTLTAVPEANHVFTGWSGDAAGTENPLSLVLETNLSVTARFEPVPAEHVLTVSTVGQGTVVADPAKAQYAAGEIVDLTAVAAAGWVFADWSGDASGSTPTVSVTMDGPKSLTARFQARPVLTPIADQAIEELQTLTLTLSATDPDSPVESLRYSLAEGPEGATVNAETGAFQWTPTEAQGPETNLVTVVVTDSGTPPLSASTSFTVTVSEVNIAPTVDAVVDQVVAENSLLTLMLTARDVDIPANTLTFRMVAGPTGLTVDPNTGEVQWRPRESQGGTRCAVDIRAADDGVPPRAGRVLFYVTAQEVNLQPQLAAVPGQQAMEGEQWSYALAANDMDFPTNTLTFRLVSAPAGMTVDPSSGVMRWVPAEDMGGSVGQVVAEVQDDGVPPLSRSVAFDIAIAEANTAPTLDPVLNQRILEGQAWSLQLTSGDVDVPLNQLRYEVVSGPAGLTVDPAAGIVRWTPGATDVGQAFDVTVRVIDDGAPNLSAVVAFSIVVDAANSPPTLNFIADQQVNELSELQVAASASDADIPAQQLTFSLVDPPGGASIDPVAGLFRWTPTEAQGPGTHAITVRVTDNGTPPASTSRAFTVRVNEMNTPPVLRAVNDQTLDEAIPWSADASAVDLDQPANVLTYSLVGPPSGMHINFASGRIEWTPTEMQGPQGYVVTVRVFDNGDPARSDTRAFNLTVRESNQAPRWTLSPGTAVVDEGSPLAVLFQAVDDDWPANTLHYSLEGAPEGASVNTETGAFQWTPTEDQGPSQQTMTVVTTDNGEPPARVTATFQVTVNEVNTAPRLAEIPDRTVNLGESVSFKATATDEDRPANTLTFSLVSPPAGASINPLEGLFSWSPDASHVGAHDITVQVADNGQPELRQSETFRVTVVRTLEVSWELAGGELVLRIPTLTGRTYRVEYQDNGIAGTWQVLVDNITGNGALKSVGEPISALVRERFYRVAELPQ